MKENFKLEELFKQKFDNFQADVDPSVWANVQAGIGAGATGAAAGGLSAAVKIGLISGGIIAASVATWYIGFYEPAGETAQNTTQHTVVSQPAETPAHTDGELITVTDMNQSVSYELPVGQQADVQPDNQSSQQTTNTVSNANNQSTTSTTSTSGSGNPNVVNNNTTGSNTTTTNNQGTNGQQTGTTTSDEDRHKELLPTGRMEFTQVSPYAPSQVTFVSNARNFEEVHWDFGDGTIAEGTEIKHAFSKPGTYEVRMTVVGEKTTYEETQEVVVKGKSSVDNVPNVITPDGDRINDYFSIKTTDIETFYITITDKRGNEIFTSTDKDFVWDGTDQSGQVVEKGSYTYVIIAEGKDGSVIKLPGQIYVQ